MKIDTIISKKQDRIPKYAERWVGLASQPINKDLAIYATKRIYRIMGYEEPLVVIGRSPASCHLLNHIFHHKNGFQYKTHAFLEDILNAQLDSRNPGIISRLNKEILEGMFYDLWRWLSERLHKQFNHLAVQLNNQFKNSTIDINGHILYGYYRDGAIYEYGDQVLNINLNKDLLDSFCEFIVQVPFIIAYKDVAFISEKPQIFWWDNKLHNEEDMAIKYPDNFGFYFLDGVPFKKELWEKIVNRELSLKEFFSIKNIEERVVALKYFGVEKLFSTANAECVDKMFPDYELYLVNNIFPQSSYFLKYSCPSTGKVYVSGVEPEVGKLNDVASALAWKFYMNKDEYNLIAES